MFMDRTIAANPKATKVFPWPALASFALIGCAPPQGNLPRTPLTAEQYELANIRFSNIIPKSSPAAFEKAFDSFCLNGGASAASTAAKLRKADYVAAPSAQNGQTVFVVDDTRPAVVLSDDGRFCAVVARSRTGQTARVQRFFAKRFPKAGPTEQGLPGVDILLQTNGKPGGLIGIKRLTAGAAGSRLALFILRGPET